MPKVTDRLYSSSSPSRLLLHQQPTSLSHSERRPSSKPRLHHRNRNLQPPQSSRITQSLQDQPSPPPHRKHRKHTAHLPPQHPKRPHHQTLATLQHLNISPRHPRMRRPCNPFLISTPGYLRSQLRRRKLLWSYFTTSFAGTASS